MSIRRSLALAGVAALASSLVLTGAQGAMAVGSPGTPSPGTPSAAAPSAAAPSAATQAKHQSLALSVHGVPDTFVAGGPARVFSYRIQNPAENDFVAFPLLKFKNKAGTLKAKDLKVEYQLPAGLPGGGTWRTGSIAPGGGDGDDGAVLILLGGVTDGGPADDALLYLAPGKRIDIDVRVSFTKDTPLGKAGVVPVVFSANADDESDNGHFSCDGIKGAGFTIKAGGGGGKPTPTPTPTKTGKPSPTATATPTTTSTPTATATATPTTTPTTPAPTTPAPTTSATGTASPSASPTDSGSGSGETTTPAPSGGSTDAQQPIDFPVDVPKVTPPKITPAVVTKAKTAATDADKSLATTGGGDDTTAIAAAGGAVLVAGVGTLVVLRRRKAGRQS
ncbi:LPXTG cell wall anchor domain-containing protein [Kitasatospora sp. NPDC101157]|uniref:LPXTG cell wall anchor domain-containing protein n=1 Tax=Kitasatospora sp. NPDC101157 TaxID=3364098 RepID=UPI0037F478CD